MPGLPGHASETNQNTLPISGHVCIDNSTAPLNPIRDLLNPQGSSEAQAYSLEGVEALTLDLADGDVTLTPEGYAQPQNGELTPYAGRYIIKGYRKSDTPLRINNETGESATFDVYFDSAEVIAADWCAAASLTCNADTVVNIINVGSSKVIGYNHPAFVGNPSDGARIIVNIFNTHHASLELNQLYLYNRTVAYAGNTNGEFLHNDAIEMSVNGTAPRNNSRLIQTEGCDVPAPATEQNGAAGGSVGRWNGGSGHAFFGRLADFLQKIMSLFHRVFGGK